MKCCDLSPSFYSISSYKYFFHEENKAKNDAVKSQYVYRCLYFTDGEVAVRLGSDSSVLHAGDLLFLVPGEEYSFSVTEDYSLIDLYFDLEGQSRESGKGVTSCIFKDEFDPALCSKSPVLSDGEALLHNRVFRNIDEAHVFSELLATSKDGVYFDLFSKICISQILYSLLTSEEKRKNSKAEKILHYINQNATEDLSAEFLERKFGYHRNHINRLLKQETGHTLSECIRKSKIEHAKSLIAEARLTQSQVAQELGYYDYSHFYKAFVKETGVSPTDNF